MSVLKIKNNGVWEQIGGAFVDIFEPSSITSFHSYVFEKIDDQNHSAACQYCGTYGLTTSHTWDAGEITVPATATSTGIKTKRCTDCDATKEEIIYALTSPKQPTSNPDASPATERSQLFSPRYAILLVPILLLPLGFLIKRRARRK